MLHLQMGVRLVETGGQNQAKAVAALIATATLDRSCMVLAFRAPASVLRRQVDEIGGDLDHLFVLDAVDQNPMSTGRSGNVMGGFNPGMLERVVLRAKQIIAREQERNGLTVILDGFDEVLTANPPAAVHEIAMRMREELVNEDTELVWVHRSDADAAFLDLIRPLVDERIRVAA